MDINLTVAICATPKRLDNLRQAINSISANRPDAAIHVFMEPWEPKLTELPKNTEIHINEEQLGCFANHANALNYLSENTDSKYVLITQEDFVLHSKASKKIDEFFKYNLDIPFGALCLYTSPKKRWDIFKQWRQKINFWYWSYWVCYIMERNVLDKIQEHPFYINHLVTYEANQQVDSTIWYILERFNLPTYYHNYSLAKHIWSSLIWHYDPEQNTFISKDTTPILWYVLDREEWVTESEEMVTLSGMYTQVDRFVNTDIDLSPDVYIINIKPGVVYPKNYVDTSLRAVNELKAPITWWCTYLNKDTTKKWIKFYLNDYIPEPLYSSVLPFVPNMSTVSYKLWDKLKPYVCIPHNKNQFKIL